MSCLGAALLSATAVIDAEASWTWRLASTNAPTTTGFYTTVCWTGAELLVWGADNPHGPYERVAWRWNPATRATPPLSLTNAPAVPDGQTALWTGRHLCVWGGRTSVDPTSATDSGFLYDPVRNAWRPMSRTNAPTRRADHTAIWTGSEMIICGGERVTRSGTGYRTDLPTDCAAYDPQSDAWRPIELAGAPPGRRKPCLAWTGSELLLFGGWDLAADGFEVRIVYFNDLWIYDLQGAKWSRSHATNAPSGRAENASAWTGTEFIVWGGYDGETYAQRRLLTDGARYIPREDRWQLMNPNPPPVCRESPAAVWTGHELIFWGGVGSAAGGVAYQPTNDSWSVLDTIGGPAAVQSHNAVWNGEEFLAVGDDVFALGPDGGYRGDGLPDAWQQSYFGADNLEAHPQRDPDRDGCINRHEWLFGTNPVDADSHPVGELVIDQHSTLLRFADLSPYLEYSLGRAASADSVFVDVEAVATRGNGEVTWLLPAATEPQLLLRLGYRERVP